MSSFPAANPPPELPPPNEADKIGPDNLKTDERMLLKPPADPPLPFESESLFPLLLPPLLLPLLEPAELPRTPLLKPANVCETAVILGVMMPEMSDWKSGIGRGASIPN